MTRTILFAALTTVIIPTFAQAGHCTFCKIGGVEGEIASSSQDTATTKRQQNRRVEIKVVFN